MAEVKLDLEKLIANISAESVLESLEEEAKQELLKESLTEYINNVADGSTYKLRQEIGNRVHMIALEILEDDDVKETMRQKAHAAVDEVIEAFATEAAHALSFELQSKYATIVKKAKERA